MKGKSTMVPLVDFQEKKRIGWKELQISPSGVVRISMHKLLFLSMCVYVCVKKCVFVNVHLHEHEQEHEHFYIHTDTYL